MGFIANAKKSIAQKVAILNIIEKIIEMKQKYNFLKKSEKEYKIQIVKSYDNFTFADGLDEEFPGLFEKHELN